MTKKQKLILIVLAVMDVLVIGGMAFVIWINGRPVSPNNVTLTSCETAIQQAMQPDYFASYNVSESNTGDLTVFLSSQTFSTPSEDEQSLWRILDSLATIVPEQCSDINTIKINLSNSDNQSYTFIVMNEDLSAWAKQDIDDAALAARISYREITND